MDGGIRSRPGRAEGAVRSAPRAPISAAPFLYGLGAMGEAGVTRALEIIRKELDIDDGASAASADIRSIDRSILDHPLPS